MYNIIPVILILASLGLIAIIVVRKFSILANLDVDNIPAEKEAKIKERIISNRLKRNIIKWTSKFTNLLKFIFEKLNILSQWIYKKVIDIKDHYKQEDLERKPEKKQATIEELLSEVDDFLAKEDMGEAEKRLITVIGLDSKNISAFKILANIYFKSGQYDESKQTYEHILKLMREVDSNESEAEIYFNMAWVEKSRENIKEAFLILGKALKIEPNNPRYLDTMLEISIINKDKVSALSAYERLEKANPENKKLEEFKNQIAEL